jgi:cell division protein ZapA (FtsZ GTPase activity inhibitor)
MPNTSYKFNYLDGDSEIIHIEIDPTTYEIKTPSDFTPPEWTKLEYNKCKNCALSSAENSHCPVAKNMAYLLSGLSSKKSYEAINLEVSTPERTYTSKTTMQRALGSMLGLIFSLSGCPGANFLKPMGVFHLPLSTEMDTLTRTFSFYVLGKFLEYREHKIEAINLEGLSASYKNLRTINQDFSKRLRNISKSDASLNAIVILDLLAQNVDFELDDKFEKLKNIFKTQLTQQEKLYDAHL